MANDADVAVADERAAEAEDPARTDLFDLPDLLFVADVLERLHVSEGTLWRMRQGGSFPPPTHRIGRRPAWSRHAYEAWLRGGNT